MICIMLNCLQSVVLKFVNGSVDPLWILLCMSRLATLIWCPPVSTSRCRRGGAAPRPPGEPCLRGGSSSRAASCWHAHQADVELLKLVSSQTNHFCWKIQVFFRCLLKLVDKKLNAKLYIIQILEAIFKEIKVLGKFVGLCWKSVRLHWGQQWAYSDTSVLNKNFWPEPSGNRGRSGLFLDLCCLPIFGFKATTFSQDTCNLGFKENRATSWPSGCFKLPSP